MILTINTEDSRDVRALQLAATADQWIELPLGGFRVPSSTGRGFYRSSAEICSCEDFGRRLEPCKHVRAVRIFLALREASQPKPGPVAAQSKPSSRLDGEALWARFDGD